MPAAGEYPQLPKGGQKEREKEGTGDRRGRRREERREGERQERGWEYEGRVGE